MDGPASRCSVSSSDKGSRVASKSSSISELGTKGGYSTESTKGPGASAEVVNRPGSSVVSTSVVSEKQGCEGGWRSMLTGNPKDRPPGFEPPTLGVQRNKLIPLS